MEEAPQAMFRIRSSSRNKNLARIEQILVDRDQRAGSSFLNAEARPQIVVELSMMGFPEQGPAPNYRAKTSETIYPVRLARSQIFFGPVVRANGPCPTCLERRWLTHRPVDERRALESFSGGFVYGDNPWLTPFALEAVWEILHKALSGPTARDKEAQTGKVYVLDLETLRIITSELISDSLCSSCSSLPEDTAAGAVLTLIARPKRNPESYRLISSNDLELGEQAYVNPVCGVLGPSALPDHTQSLTAAVTGQFQVVDYFGDRKVWWSGHANTYDLSKRIGLLEGLERHSGLLPRGKRVTVFDSLDNLGDDALDPRQCGLYDPAYYATHQQHKPFSPEMKFHWVWGYSLTQSRPVLVPKQLVYYMDYTVPEPMFVQDCSNGCAAGSCLEEAILYGLLELFERDSFLISWFAKLSLPRIDPWSCQSVDLVKVLDRINLLGCDVHLLDMRLDLKVPSVMCFTRRRDNGLGSFVLAAGAHFNPEQAIHGALCEVASYLPSAAERVAAKEPELRAMMQDYRKLDSIHDHPLLYGFPEMAAATDFLLSSPVFRTVEETYRDWLDERPRHEDLLADVRYCLDLLQSIGLEQVVVVDQTSPEQERLGLKTVSVIVPGLIPIDFGYERQRIKSLPRLYTVPRTAGFRTTDLSSAEINVLPHPFP